MYKIIMSPTEGAETERVALDLAARLAQGFGAELRLIRVETPPVAGEFATTPNVLEITEETFKEARAARRKQLEALGTSYSERYRIPVVAVLESGIVTSTLLDYATGSDVDLIVMSSHTRGGVKRVTLGSVADYLIRKSDIPVLLVKPAASAGADASSTPVSRIVVPLDGSALAEEIIPQVIALGRQLKSSVDLFHVLTPHSYSQKQIMQPGLPWWDEEISVSKRYLEEVASRLLEAGIPVTTEVVLGEDIVAAIFDYTDRAGADLIAITTNGAGGLNRFVFGSVADEITRSSGTSVLVYHPSEARVESSEPHAKTT